VDDSVAESLTAATTIKPDKDADGVGAAVTWVNA